MVARFSYLSYLQCSMCHRQYESDQLQTISPCCARPLLAKYDLAAVTRDVKRDEIARRENSIWRYHELLPVSEEARVLTLGEGMTPLLAAPRLAPPELEKDVRLLVKDEGQNPTGSFKARGMAVAVARALELGARGLVTPTAGNAGAAMAAYAARAGLPVCVVAPEDAPQACIQQARLYGAEVTLIAGLISDAAQVAASVAQQRGWFNLATLREPYRVEGKKTMGFELAEQLDWRLPDAIIYPAGGGTGVIGMWKAFAELRELGWLQSERQPKMIIVQAQGCAPLIRAFEQGNTVMEAWPSSQANTVAAGLRVPMSIGDQLILQAVRESGGTAVRVSDDAMMEMVRHTARKEGMLIALEAAATLAAYHILLATRFLTPEDETVLFFTGTGLPDIGNYSFSM